MTNQPRIPDVPPAWRPGVPMEKSPHHPLRRDPEVVVAESPVKVLTEPSRRLTPVYSTREPPRGLSGAVREVAYGYPDYRVRRWLLLLVADRLDAQEARLKRLASRPLAWAVFAGGLALGAGLTWRWRATR